jgi:hypothetical protein
MLGYMFWFVQGCMMQLMKAWALLSFFCAGCTHFISLSFTIWQTFHNASNFPAASPLTLMPPQKSIHFVAIVPLGWIESFKFPSPYVLLAPNHLSLTWLAMWSGLSHRLQVMTDTSGTQLEQLSTFNCCQPTRWVGLTNSKSTCLCQSTIPHSTRVELFYSVREINIPNIVWDNCGMWHIPNEYNH